MKFIAHRGYRKCFPENTLQAFDAVIRHPQNGKNLIGIELDIHATIDNHIVVMHSTEIESESGKRLAVADITHEQLLSAASQKNSDTNAAIPGIDDVLELVNHKTELCFEIKQASYNRDAFIAALIQSFERYKPAQDVVISSFSHEIIDAVAKAAKHLDLKYAFIFKTLDAFESLPLETHRQLHYLHPHYKLLLENPQAFTSNAQSIQCWTVNEASDIDAIIKLHVSRNIRSIMTDDIEFSNRYGDS